MTAGTRSVRRACVGVVALGLVASCGGDDDSGSENSWVGDIEAAMEAVEDARGGGQEYFEVTASPRLTNVFVAVEAASAAVPYVFLDGELQEPAPVLDGASGFTFALDDVDIDDDAILSTIEAELPEVTIDALSVEGGPDDSVRYVVSARSEQGGVLDITVGPGGAVFAVDPL